MYENKVGAKASQNAEKRARQYKGRRRAKMPRSVPVSIKGQLLCVPIKGPRPAKMPRSVLVNMHASRGPMPVNGPKACLSKCVPVNGPMPVKNKRCASQWPVNMRRVKSMGQIARPSLCVPVNLHVFAMLNAASMGNIIRRL